MENLGWNSTHDDHFLTVKSETNLHCLNYVLSDELVSRCIPHAIAHYIVYVYIIKHIRKSQVRIKSKGTSTTNQILAKHLHFTRPKRLPVPVPQCKVFVFALRIYLSHSVEVARRSETYLLYKTLNFLSP